MNWATPYESARSCTGSARQGARALLAWGLETYPDAFSMGIYNCRTVVGGSTTSTHGEGRAVDLGLPVGRDGRGTPLGHSIVARLGDHGARLGIQAIVYDRTVWSAKSPSGRYYSGQHPHYDHLHIELTMQAADRLTLATFRTVLNTGGIWMPDAVILVHPSTSTPDSLAGLLGLYLRPDQDVVLTCNADTAKDALRAGKRVHAVGGAASNLVAGDNDLRGASRLDTAEKVIAQARRGW